MKKLMFALLCVFMFGSANVVMAQDPVKTTTEQKEDKKEVEKEETDAKAEVSKEETGKAEEAKTEKAEESTPVEKKADEPAK